MGASNSAVSNDDSGTLDGNSGIVVANIEGAGVIVKENQHSSVGGLSTGTNFCLLSTSSNANINAVNSNSSIGYHVEVNEGNKDRGKYVYFVPK